MTRTERGDAVRSMYETYPFPNREDFGKLAPGLVRRLRAHGGAMSGKWLDLGCGTGEVLLAAAGLAPDMEFVGVDFSAASVAVARERMRKLESRNVQVIRGNILDPEWVDGSWDVVSALGSLHHLEDPRVGFANAAQALKPGGLFVFYFYGKHGRYLRTLEQRLLSKLFPDPGAFRERVAFAKTLFAPKNYTTEGPMEDQIIADEYAHPCEHTYTICEVEEELLRKNELSFVEWLSVPEDPAEVFGDLEVVERCRALSPGERRAVFDLWFRREDNVVIARKISNKS